jgi:hypothetical protein
MPKLNERVPEGFSIEKYKLSDEKEFGPLQWADQIERRLELQDSISMQMQLSACKIARGQSKGFDNQMQLLFDRPLTRYLNGFWQADLPNPAKSGSVFPLTTYEFFRLYEDLRRNRKEPPPDYWEGGASSDEDLDWFDASSISLDETLDPPTDNKWTNSVTIENGRYARLVIDRFASEEILAKDFINWVKHDRETKTAKQPIITKVKLSQWWANKVLPYADLKIWSMWSGIKLTEPEIIKLILSADQQEANHPLKSTIRDYKSAMSWPTVRCLINSSRKLSPA